MVDPFVKLTTFGRDLIRIELGVKGEEPEIDFTLNIPEIPLLEEALSLTRRELELGHSWRSIEVTFGGANIIRWPKEDDDGKEVRP